ncbi:MAG: hypothetical protein LBV51_02680 [Acholeplasmatales bacterium]|jgi:hypothetical protein|nr:hypothetical protein [Acholeplasmatales bacterium]
MSNKGQVSKSTKFFQFLNVLFLLIQLAIAVLMFWIGKSNTIVDIISIAIIGFSILSLLFILIVARKKTTNDKMAARRNKLNLVLNLLKAIIMVYYAVSIFREIRTEGGATVINYITFGFSVFMFLFTIYRFFKGIKKANKALKEAKVTEAKNKEKEDKKALKNKEKEERENKNKK